MCFILDTGSEIQPVGVAAVAAVAHDNSPKALDREITTKRVPEGTDEIPTRWVVGVNFPITKISHEKCAGKSSPETVRSHRQTPRRVQKPAGSNTCEQIAVEVKFVHVAIADADDFFPFAVAQ